MLSRADRIAVRCIYDDDAMFCGSIDIDVVHADSGTGDDSELPCITDDLFSDGRLTPDDQCMVVVHRFQNFLFTEPGVDIDIIIGMVEKLPDAVFTYRVEHEYFIVVHSMPPVQQRVPCRSNMLFCDH